MGIALLLAARLSSFDSRQGKVIFLFSVASRRALLPTQPPIQFVAKTVSQGLKRPGRGADHSPTSTNVEVKLGALPQFPISLHGTEGS
jgi:hypothetical protein